MKKTIFTIISLVFLTACNNQPLVEETPGEKTIQTNDNIETTPVEEQTLADNKEIEKISDVIIEKALLVDFPKCYKEYEKGIKCLSDRYFFDIYMKNIGTAPIYPHFYIDNTLTDEDIEKNEYPNASMTNSVEVAIKEGETKVYKHSVIIEGIPPEKIKFNLNQEHEINGEKLAQQKEKDYTNNSYIAEVQSVMNIK